MESDETTLLVEELKKYDNEEGYKLSYKEVRERLSGAVQRLTAFGEECLDHVHPLLEHSNTWSCTFACDVLRGIKSEKSVTPLIQFIKDNEEGEWWESCDDATHALIAIGKPAVKHLLKETKAGFEAKMPFSYLTEALLSIKDEEVYSFAAGILEDYVKNPKEYAGWFELELFVACLRYQGKKELLPPLKKLVTVQHLTKQERCEIKDAILSMENPDKYYKKFETVLKILKPILPKENVARAEKWLIKEKGQG